MKKLLGKMKCLVCGYEITAEEALALAHLAENAGHHFVVIYVETEAEG